jgi:hypothetical protein
MNCLMNCYNKYYRYLAFSNTLYTFLVQGEKVDAYLKSQEEGNDAGAGDALASDMS